MASSHHGEYQSLIDLNVFQFLSTDDVPPGHNIIDSMVKTKTDGQFKGRVVTTGGSQRHGIDRGRTFAPVCCIGSPLLVAVVVVNEWSAAAIESSTAFLNGKLFEEVYMRQAPGFETKNSRGRPLIMKLRISIYRLWQSPKAWNSTIDKDLQAIGFQPTASDRCVYLKDSGDNYVILTLYVDDLLITGHKHSSVAKVRKTLMHKFPITDFGDVTRILGIDIIQDKERGTISISQAPYVIARLDKYGIRLQPRAHTWHWHRADDGTKRQRTT